MAELLTKFEMLKELPCRRDFLMMDRALREGSTKITGYKAVSNGEWYFMGHFPGHPIMPGVLQLEGFCQLAELLCWKELDPERKNDVYLKNLNRVKFRQPSIPGDRLRFTVEQIGKTDAGIEFSCLAENNAGAACEAKIVMAVRPRIKLEIPELFNECDRTAESLMDISGITKIIPHRYPFLLVDYVHKVEDSNLLAVKNACSDERAFRCYADGYSVFSGAILPEIIAQAACVGVLNREENRKKLAYFMAIDKTEFFRPVNPGDQIICDIVCPDSKKRVGKGTGEMKVGNEILMRTEITYVLVDA